MMYTIFVCPLTQIRMEQETHMKRNCKTTAGWQPRRRLRPHPEVPALIILIFCCSIITACGSGTYSSTASGEPLSIQDAMELIPRKLIRVGVVQVGHESDWRIASTRCCQEVFSEEKGYQLYFVDADNNPEAQADAVRSFIQERVDYIVIAPILTTGWNEVLKEAYHVGIPVFVMDRTIDCDSRYYQSWFGSDFMLEGECAGQWLQKYLRRQGRSFEEIRIVTINGTPGASAQLGRTLGFRKYLEQNNNWKLLAEKSGNFTESGGQQVMEDYLKTYPDIDVVICQNDNEALGACRALEEADISYGKDGDVIIISFDATRAGLEAVLDGDINADFECNPQAPFYVAGAIQTLEAGGELTEKEYYLPEEGFTCEEEPAFIAPRGRTMRMIPVTRDVLKQRVY